MVDVLTVRGGAAVGRRIECGESLGYVRVTGKKNENRWMDVMNTGTALDKKQLPTKKV